MPNKDPSRTAVGAYYVLHTICFGIFLSHCDLSDNLLVSWVVIHIGILWLIYAFLTRSDPGYYSSTEDEKEYRNRLQEPIHGLLEQGHVVLRLKSHYCTHCKIEQPIRTKHCKECEKCVNCFDHHCFWIGNCVGEKNHRLFVIFLFFQIGLFGMAIWQFASAFQKAPSVFEWLFKNWILLSGLLMSIIFFFVTIGLFVFHFYLISTNQTTWETMGTSTYMTEVPDGVLPFNRGVWVNCLRFWLKNQNNSYKELPLTPPLDEDGEFQKSCLADCC